MPPATHTGTPFPHDDDRDRRRHRRRVRRNTLLLACGIVLGGVLLPLGAVLLLTPARKPATAPAVVQGSPKGMPARKGAADAAGGTRATATKDATSPANGNPPPGPPPPASTGAPTAPSSTKPVPAKDEAAVPDTSADGVCNGRPSPYLNEALASFAAPFDAIAHRETSKPLGETRTWSGARWYFRKPTAEERRACIAFWIKEKPRHRGAKFVEWCLTAVFEESDPKDAGRLLEGVVELAPGGHLRVVFAMDEAGKVRHLIEMKD